MPFASGKQSEALCDICGQRCKYSDLKRDIYNEKYTGLLVCPVCQDKDNPQLQVGKWTARAEGIALENPRPDTPDWVSRGYASWNPVQSLTVQLSGGQVRVSTS